MTEQSIMFEDNHESDRDLSEDETKKLRPYAGVKLKKLCADNPSLLLFPSSFGDNGDDIDEPLYSFVGSKLWTGNIVGFWGVNGVNVRVHSRFDTAEKQHFFHYMLQRIAGINVLDFKTLPDPEGIWDFLLYLFPMVLKHAIRQGVYRTYRVFQYNDDRVRGTIDVSRFIRCDVPFAGRIAYNTREHTANNHVLHLIRYTIEYIRRKVPVLLRVDSEMRQAVDLVIQVTPDYADQTLSKVIAANLRPIRHPFYSAYTELQKLCLRILRHEKLSFGESDGSICGIAFDAAWLWEEYLNTVFKSNIRFTHMIHPQNKQRKDPVYFYRNKKHSGHYPDFHDPSSKMVLDAKYKRNNGIDRNDLFQMISYLHILEYQRGIFLKPSDGDTEYYEDGILDTTNGETIGVLSLKIPRVDQSSCYLDFVRQIGEEEKRFQRNALELIC